MISLRDLRIEKGLTQKRLAKLAGVGESTIANYEVGRTDVSDAILKRLAKALGIGISEIRSDRPEREIITVVRGGPAAAARKMSERELTQRIKQHAVELGRADEYMRGAQAEIIAAFALELYNRSKLGQLRETMSKTKRKGAAKKS